MCICVVKLMFYLVKLRLMICEVYEVYCDIIEWYVQFSKDKVFDQVFGVS